VTRAAAGAIAQHPIAPRQLLLVLLLTLVWGCTWPVLKMGLTELAPLTFRALTLPFAALSLLAVSKLSGASLRIPRRLWPKVAALALFNIAFWNGLTLFGLQQLPAGNPGASRLFLNLLGVGAAPRPVGTAGGAQTPR